LDLEKLPEKMHETLARARFCSKMCFSLQSRAKHVHESVARAQLAEKRRETNGLRPVKK
jgi:hypothetical protein